MEAAAVCCAHPSPVGDGLVDKTHAVNSAAGAADNGSYIRSVLKLVKIAAVGVIEILHAVVPEACAAEVLVNAAAGVVECNAVGIHQHELAVRKIAELTRDSLLDTALRGNGNDLDERADLVLVVVLDLGVEVNCVHALTVALPGKHGRYALQA